VANGVLYLNARLYNVHMSCLFATQVFQTGDVVTGRKREFEDGVPVVRKIQDKDTCQ
jgi:hypothetical protein